MRLAEARDFPIFVLASDDLFVDTIIIEVNRRIERLRAETDLLAALDRIARESRPSEAVREQAHDLLPSLMERCIVLFSNTHDAIDADAFESVEKAWKASGLSRPGSLLAPWRDGIVIVCTQQPSLPLEAEDVIEAFRHDIAPSLDTRDKGLTTAIGTSSRHDQLSELGCALCEAYEASCIASSRGRDEMGYDELGILGAILPNLRGDFEGDPPLVEWANGLLGPMRDRDDETGGKLSETLVSYFENGESIPSTAATLGQHENTVRYRLTRIGDLTGADWREAEGREQLSLACHILECRDALCGMRSSRRPVPSPSRQTLSE
jgi:sugar diacid utilization regulator